MTIALIDIKSDFARLTIANRILDNDFEIIETSEKSLNLTADIVECSKISSENIYNTIRVIKGFLELIKPYQIKENNIYLIGTKSFNFAKNKYIVVEQIQSKTGLNMQILESIEENQLNFLSFKKFSKKHFDEIQNSSSLIVELSQSGTEILYIKKDNSLIPINTDIGLFSIKKYYNSISMNRLSSTQSMILQHIENAKKEIQILSASIDYLILFGKLARDIISLNEFVKNSKKYWILDNLDFKKHIREIINSSFDEMTKKYKITLTQAENLYFSSIFYFELLIKFNPKQIVILNLTTGSRLLNYYLLEDRLSGLFEKQILPTLEYLLNKYQCNKKYATYMRVLSVNIFDKTIYEHRLSNKERLYLEISSTLLEIGKFISYTNYHLHSKYIVENINIFGLNKEDMRIIGLIVQYSFDNIKDYDIEYKFLDTEKQIVIKKLASILNLTIYLENTYMQKIQDFEIRIKKDQMFILLKLESMFFVEKRQDKINMFEDTFGYKLIID